MYHTINLPIKKREILCILSLYLIDYCQGLLKLAPSLCEKISLLKVSLINEYEQILVRIVKPNWLFGKIRYHFKKFFALKEMSVISININATDNLI